MANMKTTIRVGDGPEIPIDLDSPDAPENAAAKEAIGSMVRKAVGDGGEGHNSSTVAASQLRLFIERIERLEEEKKGIADDIRDAYAEAKANGYDTKIMRLMVRLRKMETHQRQEQAAIAETYASALGLQGVLPL